MSSNAAINLDPASLSRMLGIYYKRIFPCYIFSKWLAYGEPGVSNEFRQREFSFTIKNDVYLRYQSFNSHIELENELVRTCPFKVDIGAVYNTEPKTYQIMKIGAYEPLQRELILDIDLTDYDDVRRCCKEGDVCSRCWKLMHIAVDVLDSALREDFGFDWVLWVFSGRRGIHCWVCDEKARLLPNRARECIVEYLTVLKAGSGGWCKRVYLQHPLHPMLDRARHAIEQHFEQYACELQDFLSSSEDEDKILQLCPLEHRDLLKGKWSTLNNSLAKWKLLCQHFANAAAKNRQLNRAYKTRNSPGLIPTEIMFQLCYPRIDGNVTKSMNHLLKAPFCVHPKTGKLSVPIPNVNLFKLEDVPNIADLIDDISEQPSLASPSKQKTRATKDYKKTRLRPFVEFFESFVRSLLEDGRHKRLLTADIQSLSISEDVT